jgi:hypothetical protein
VDASVVFSRVSVVPSVISVVTAQAEKSSINPAKGMSLTVIEAIVFMVPFSWFVLRDRRGEE